MSLSPQTVVAVKHTVSLTCHEALKWCSAVISDAFCRDWMNRYHGQSRLALLPKSTEEVSEILKYCNKRRLAVVPQVRDLL